MQDLKRERKAPGVNTNQASALESLKASRKEGKRVNQKKV